MLTTPSALRHSQVSTEGGELRHHSRFAITRARLFMGKTALVAGVLDGLRLGGHYGGVGAGGGGPLKLVGLGLAVRG